MGFSEGDREAKKTFGLKPHAIDKGTREAARIFGMRHSRDSPRMRKYRRRPMVRGHRCGPNCPHLSIAARNFIGRKIRSLMLRGVPQRDAIAIAFSEARRKGYHVPRRA